MSQGSNGRQTDGQAGPTGNFLKTFKPRSLAAGKWIGKCGASEGANGSPQLSMAFSLGPNGHLRFASLPCVGVLNTWPKCILCQNVQLDVKLTAFNFQIITLKQKNLPCAGVKTSPYFNICLCQKMSGCHNFLAQKVGGVSGCWASRVEGLPGRTGGTPPVTGQSHSGLGGASLCPGRTRSSFSISGHSTELSRGGFRL